MPARQQPSIHYISEQAIALQFEQVISADVAAHINTLNHYLQAHAFTGFRTTVPAYTSLTIFFDPLMVSRSEMPGNDCFEKVSNYVNGINAVGSKAKTSEATRVTIPICYNEEFGLDLAELAALHQLTIDEIISLHSNAVYRVYMIGFVPGFAYLGGLDQRLNTPRKGTPRKVVPAGSVGVAGEQTGIYPLQTPGGWQIIGRTPLTMFDHTRTQPSLLKAGDEVVFKPITIDEFHQISAGK